MRRHHVLQRTIPSARKFAQERKENVTSTIWSDFETITLRELAKYEQLTNYPAIQKLYNDIVYYSTAPFCTNELTPDIIFRRKSLLQVQAKLQHMQEREHIMK